MNPPDHKKVGQFSESQIVVPSHGLGNCKVRRCKGSLDNFSISRLALSVGV